MNKKIDFPPTETEIVPTQGGGMSMTAAYERYFRSGVYDARYPEANRSVVTRIRAALPSGGHVIDYGCGSGRYLFALRDRVGRAAGFDISPAALDLLRQRAVQDDWPDLGILGPDPVALRRQVARHGPADLVLCLFGVLGHMADRAARRAALLRMSGLLRPGTGRLVLSVPNRWRRFYAEQWRAGADANGSIQYTRQMDGAPVRLHYQLFSPASLRAELAEAGLRIESLHAESLFGESLLARNRVAQTVDMAINPVLPVGAGYGLLAVAAPMAGPVSGPVAGPDR